MQKVQIDATDLLVSRFGFGTASLHHVYSQSGRIDLLHAAHAAGISHFDTSPYYGYGLAENSIGLFSKGRRDRITVASKIGLYAPGKAAGTPGVWLRKAAGRIFPSASLPRVDWSIPEAERSLDASLKRLGTDYLDILFLHEPDAEHVDADTLLDWLVKQRSKGKIRHWGVAGIPGPYLQWLAASHPIAGIVQCKDSLDKMQADVVMKQRTLQFTYGYLSSAPSVRDGGSIDSIISKVLKRNPNGAILFSSRNRERIESIARMVV